MPTRILPMPAELTTAAISLGSPASKLLGTVDCGAACGDVFGDADSDEACLASAGGDEAANEADKNAEKQPAPARIKTQQERRTRNPSLLACPMSHALCKAYM